MAEVQISLDRSVIKDLQQKLIDSIIFNMIF